jgi:hypothetical protein
MEESALLPLKEKLSKVSLLPLREQARLADIILKKKLDTVLPLAMGETGIDCWIVIARENNDDPVMKTLFSSDMPSARRIAIFAFFLAASDSVKRFYIGPPSPGMAAIYETPKRDGEEGLPCLRRLAEEYNPRKLAINASKNFGFCDGISATLLDELKISLGDFSPRVSGGEDLSIRWLETMTDIEVQLIRTMAQVTGDIIKTVFNSRFVEPEATTTTDLEWHMRDSITELGFTNWFGPDVDLQRHGDKRTRIFESAIKSGDLLHCDIGMSGKYVRLNTDMQWLAYVLRQNEKRAPNELAGLLKRGNRFQDIVCSCFKEGVSGNDVFQKAISQAKAEGITPMLYTHPIGTFGHGAGPIIGSYTDQSGFIPIKGERLLRGNGCFALELNVSSPLAIWGGKETFAYLEESVYFDGLSVEYLNKDGRQTELIEL